TICGLILRLYRHEFAAVGGSIRFRVATFIQVTGQKGAALIGTAAVILVALLLSRSRGGRLATALGLCVLVGRTLWLRKQQFVGRREAIIVFGAGLVAAAFLVFGDLVVGKITQHGFSDAGRPAVYTITARSILGAPLLGYGYGTFADVFPMFRDHSV